MNHRTEDDLTKELVSKRRPRTMSDLQRKYARKWDQTFEIRKTTKQKLLPDDQKIADRRKAAMDAYEEKMMRDEQKEIWE